MVHEARLAISLPTLVPNRPPERRTDRILDRVRNMTNYIVMIHVNVYEIKARLSEFLARVEAGEVVRICRRNVPVAELRRLEEARGQPRPRGLAKGLFKVPESFFEPLPPEVVDGFDGKGS